MKFILLPKRLTQTQQACRTVMELLNGVQSCQPVLAQEALLALQRSDSPLCVGEFIGRWVTEMQGREGSFLTNTQRYLDTYMARCKVLENQLSKITTSDLFQQLKQTRQEIEELEEEIQDMVEHTKKLQHALDLNQQAYTAQAATVEELNRIIAQQEIQLHNLLGDHGLTAQNKAK